MPLSPTLLSGAIKFQMAGVGFAGRDMFKLADAIGRAVFIHVSTPNMTLSSLAGTIGPVGTVNNVAPVVGIVPTVMSNLINANGLQSGFVGRDLRKLSQAISFGLSQVLLTMVLNGSAIGVSVGGGSAKFAALNPTVLGNLLKVQMASVGFAGRDMFKLATMVSTGVVMHLMSSATFPVVSVGVIAPIPPVGPLPIAAVPTVFSKIS
jgi:hypothetical protein